MRFLKRNQRGSGLSARADRNLVDRDFLHCDNGVTFSNRPSCKLL